MLKLEDILRDFFVYTTDLAIHKRRHENTSAAQVKDNPPIHLFKLAFFEVPHEDIDAYPALTITSLLAFTRYLFPSEMNSTPVAVKSPLAVFLNRTRCA